MKTKNTGWGLLELNIEALKHALDDDRFAWSLVSRHGSSGPRQITPGARGRPQVSGAAYQREILRFERTGKTLLNIR
jgi:hypothetical protein